MFGVTFNFKGVAPLTAEQLDGCLISWKFVGRQQINGVDFFQRALGVGIKQTQTVDFVIKEIKAIRQFTAHWEQVQQCTACGVFTVLHNLINMAITSAVQLLTQGITRQALTLFHHQRMTV